MCARHAYAQLVNFYAPRQQCWLLKLFDHDSGTCCLASALQDMLA